MGAFTSYQSFLLNGSCLRSTTKRRRSSARVRTQRWSRHWPGAAGRPGQTLSDPYSPATARLTAPLLPRSGDSWKTLQQPPSKPRSRRNAPRRSGTAFAPRAHCRRPWGKGLHARLALAALATLALGDALVLEEAGAWQAARQWQAASRSVLTQEPARRSSAEHVRSGGTHLADRHVGVTDKSKLPNWGFSEGSLRGRGCLLALHAMCLRQQRRLCVAPPPSKQ